jgi:replicative superfamily II helicase
MRTSEYPWYRPDFYEYNVAQEAVIPFCDQDVNMVVCFGTAVGKTVVAECCFGYHLSNDAKAAYVSPYRSLCAEKFEKWSGDIHFRDGRVAIQTGDNRSNERRLMTAALTVMTSESFDGRTRMPRPWREWMGRLGCVVFDEAHTIGDPSRGAAIEAAMMRFTERNPACRLVLLSATMDNAMEVARWVKSLNGKPTKYFTSDWRPNEVEVLEFPEGGWEDMIDRTVERAVGGSGKTIVFVHSKTVGKTVVKKLRKAGVKTAFHNASVRRGMRERMERMFDDPDSGLDVLVSTSTLGAGVNIG